MYLGRLRDMHNVTLNSSTEKFNRGDRSGDVNILGVKGELIFAHHLWMLDVNFMQCDILSGRPVSGADFVLDYVRIDVKTIRADATDLLVNYDAHHKEKDVTHYAFIQITSPGIARYWIHSKDSVSKWKVKNVRYSNAYYRPI